MSKSPATNEMLRKFGKRLEVCRKAAGYETETALAKDLDIEPHTYRKYVRGESMPPLDTLQNMSDILGKRLDFLLLGRSPADLDEKPRR